MSADGFDTLHPDAVPPAAQCNTDDQSLRTTLRKATDELLATIMKVCASDSQMSAAKDESIRPGSQLRPIGNYEKKMVSIGILILI